jgi:hypothetical protein
MDLLPRYFINASEKYFKEASWILLNDTSKMYRGYFLRMHL